VYRSTSSGHLKVAFSVPIENGKKGKAREVVGVLAMSVDLGEFNVLQKDLPPGLEVVLIDLRQATIDGQTRRGLILHHQADASYRKGAAPPWISSELFARIDKLVENAASEGLDTSMLLTDYRDEALTGGKQYWGAIEPVIDRQSANDRQADEVGRNIRWLVLVQEPYDE
jgi:hypothetical protein